jgi:hypothetical protein
MPVDAHDRASAKQVSTTSVMVAFSPPRSAGTRMPSRRCALAAANASLGNLASRSTAPALAAATAATAAVRLLKSGGAEMTSSGGDVTAPRAWPFGRCAR